MNIKKIFFRIVRAAALYSGCLGSFSAWLTLFVFYFLILFLFCISFFFFIHIYILDRSAGVLLDVCCFVSNMLSNSSPQITITRVSYFLYEKKRKVRKILPSCQKCILFVSYLSKRIQVYKYTRIHTQNFSHSFITQCLYICTPAFV